MDAQRQLGPDTLIGATYQELRRIAAKHMRAERSNHTLQPTALVHEAWLRLRRRNDLVLRGRTHFIAIAATEMRRVLVEHARAAASQKRGAGMTRVTLNPESGSHQTLFSEVLALDEALHHLEQRSPRQSRIAELRLFAGLTITELAQVIKVSERTINSDWRTARAFLAQTLRASKAG